MQPNRWYLVVVFFLVEFSCLYGELGASTIDWAIVGEPGNAPDTEVMNDGTTGYGSVGYTFRLSKYETTNAQYVEFLNAIAADDVHDLYDTRMTSSSIGGIIRSGSQGAFSYDVKPAAIGAGPGGTDYEYANKPVVFVSYLDAMRFVNWLENGKPVGAQLANTTEQGTYQIADGSTELRDPNARYFLPNENEWYKAAYFHPDGFYFDFPTSSDAEPTNDLPDNDTGSSANFNSGFVFGAPEYTTGSASFPLTEVGAYSLSKSPHGTFDQGGNVIEWNETLLDTGFRSVRGGDWLFGNKPNNFLHANYRSSSSPLFQDDFVGFRVASIIPEPSASVLALTIFSILILLRITRSILATQAELRNSMKCSN